MDVTALIDCYWRVWNEDDPATGVSFAIPLDHQLLATRRFVTMLPMTMAQLGGHLHLKALDVRFRGVPRSVAVMTVRGRTLVPLAPRFIECARDTARWLAATRRPSRCTEPQSSASASPDGPLLPHHHQFVRERGVQPGVAADAPQAACP